MKNGGDANMDLATKKLAEYVRDKGYSLLNVSKKTGIPYGRLYPCFSGKRSLRADEFLIVCKFLEKDPFQFSEEMCKRKSQDSGQEKPA